MKKKWLKNLLYIFIITFLIVCIGSIKAQELDVSKPLILAFQSQKAKVEGGEKINFLALYALPNGTQMAEEKWSYRPLFLNEEYVVFEKPEVLFAPGQYEVALQIKDSHEVWSEPALTYITVSKNCSQSEVAYMAQKNIKGAKFNLFETENYRLYKKITGTRDGVVSGKLIISDSPEKVKEKGILYEGISNGTGRLLMHHLHDMKDGKDYRMMILVTNLSKEKQRIRINNYAIKGPSEDVLYVGEQLLLDYWDNQTREVVYDLPAGQTGIIYKQELPWKRGDALSSYIDFHTEDRVKWQVLCVENGDNFETYRHYCAKDQHIRGTFETMKKIYYIDLDTELAYFSIGEGMEEFLIGFDEVLGKEVYNKGNFGMEYELHLKAVKDTFVVFNPRGDVFRGALMWNGKVYAMPNKGCLKGKGEASFLGEIQEGEEAIVKYILPNGSSAPVLFVFVPKNNLEKMSILKEICKAYKPF